MDDLKADGSEPESVVKEGLLETAVSVITQPVLTLRRVTREQRVGWGIGLVAVVAGASLALQAATVSPRDFAGEPSQAADSFESGVRVVLIIGALTLGPIMGLSLVALTVGVVHLTSKLLRGSGIYAGLFVGFAFAEVPTALGIPVGLIPLVLGAGGVLAWLVQSGLTIWSIVLVVIAVRENNEFTTGRAIAAFLIPVGVMALAFTLLIVLFVVLLIAAFAFA